MADIDTGIGSAPTTRPSTFTPTSWLEPATEGTSLPPSLYPAASGMTITMPPTAGDYGTAATVTALANVFDDILNVAVTIKAGG